MVNHPILTPAESQLYFPAGAHMLTGRRELYRQLAARPLLRHPVWRVPKSAVTFTGNFPSRRMSYTWPARPPGRYTASLRFRPIKRKLWLFPRMQWRLQAGQEILQVTTDFRWWLYIYWGRTPPDMGELSVIMEEEEGRRWGWIRVQLGGLHSSEEAQITFQVTFMITSILAYYQGLKYFEKLNFIDFVELRMDDHT